MAQRIGKCTNYSGCKLAYRNEKITVVTKDFRCPECGSPLEPIGPKRSVSPMLVLSIGVAAVLILAIGAILWTLSSGQKRVTEVVEAPTPSPTPPPTPTPTPTPPPSPTPTPTPTTTLTPSTTPVVEASGTPLSFDITLPEIAEVKRLVLKRIDLMPNVTQQNKDRLYSAVDRARGMGRLFTISFETSFTKVTPQDVAYMRTQRERPDIK